VTVLAQSALWPTLALVIFFAAFLAVLAWVLCTPISRWQRDASMPLREQPVESRTEENRT
jgi:hypothetical protein